MERPSKMLTLAAVLLAAATIAHCVGLKVKRPPAVTSNNSFRNLTTRPLLPGQLNDGPGDTDMTERDMERTLDRHNEHRGNAGASDMKFMSWDSSLATMAQQWADLCVFEHGLPRDDNISPFDQVGQNLWLRTGDPRKPSSGVVATDDWHDEIKFYNYDYDTCSNVCGHYTQIVWAETEKVGCGVKFCNSISGYRDAWNIVCNYGPGGNYVGKKPFQTGDVCSNCNPGTPFCFGGLCRLCNLDEAGCSCKLTCQNCGTLNKDKCYCDCPDGYTGSGCQDECQDTHNYCWANPGWPGPSSCSLYDAVPKGCPLMCGLCNERDPNFVCDPNRPPTPPKEVTTPQAVCDAVFDSAAVINDELHVVKGKKFWRFDDRGVLLSPTSGELVKQFHKALSKGVKAMYQITGQGHLEGTISLIKGKKLWRFDSTGERVGGYPKNIATLLGIRDKIVAAVHDERYGVTYLLAAKTSEIYKFDEYQERLKGNNPVALSSKFTGLPPKISSAFRKSGYFYFLKSKRVYKVNENSMSVEGQPLVFAEEFLGC